MQLRLLDPRTSGGAGNGAVKIAALAPVNQRAGRSYYSSWSDGATDAGEA